VKVVFFLILIVFPFGQLLRWQLPFLPEVRLQPLDFLTFSLVCLWFFRKIFRKEKWVPPVFFKEMALFGVIAAISLLLKVLELPLKEFLPAFFYLLRLWNWFFFYWALTDFLARESFPLTKYLVLEGVAIAFLALSQYLLLPDTRFLLFLGWDDHFFRAIGSFLDPAFTGLLLALAFFVWITEVLKRRKPAAFWLAGGIILLALALTFSRLSYLVLLAGLAIIFWQEKRRLAYLFFGGLFVVLLWFLPKPAGEGVNLWRLSSFIARSENYRQVWQVIQKHWLFGVGFNTYRYTQRDADFVQPNRWVVPDLWQKSNAAAGADNSFLFVWATTGIFGLLSYLWWWGKIIAKSWRGRKTGAGLLVLASVVAITVSSLAVNSLFYPWVLGWLWLLLIILKAES
jgi:O-antigen ligase